MSSRQRNQHFAFKQFTIRQERCAMKVSSDACLFGALIDVAPARRIIDIGAGTGLLSLMLAQRSNAQVDAVELDSEAHAQCLENFSGSPFASRLVGHHDSIQDFAMRAEQRGRFDLVVANPPFFVNSSLSRQRLRAQARHADALPFPALLQAARQLMEPEGRFWVLLPEGAARVFASSASSGGFAISRRLHIAHAEGDPPHRTVFELRFAPCSEVDGGVFHLAGKEMGEKYSADVKRLLRDFYLKL